MISWLKRLRFCGKPVSPKYGEPPIWFEGSAEQRYAALADYWAQAEIGRYTPAHDEDGIRALEACYGIRLPSEFSTYLTIAAPREQFMDNETIT